MPANASPPSCFSGILRCLLCKGGSLQTHPSDHRRGGESNVKEEEAEYHLKRAYERSASYGAKNKPALAPPPPPYSPGLVARLMGLDALPPDDPRNPTLGSIILRSRSVNSIDFLSRMDLHYQKHRRVRTSVSFHEDDYYSVVLRLEEEEEAAGGENERPLKNKAAPSSNGREEKRDEQKKTKKSKKRVLERKVVVLDGGCVLRTCSDDGSNGVKTSSRLRERRKIPRNEAFTCPSEPEKIVARKVHSMPVRNLKKIHPEYSVRDAELAKESLSRKSSKSSETAEPNKISFSRGDGEENRSFVEGIVEKSKGEEFHCERIVEVICDLTEESLDENWMRGEEGVSKYTEEFCRQFEDAILQDLLTQFVDEEVVIVFRGASKATDV